MNINIDSTIAAVQLTSRFDLLSVHLCSAIFAKFITLGSGGRSVQSSSGVSSESSRPALYAAIGNELSIFRFVFARQSASDYG